MATWCKTVKIFNDTVASDGNVGRKTFLTAGTSYAGDATTEPETVDVNAKKSLVKDSISNQDTKPVQSWRNKPRLRAPWRNPGVITDGKTAEILVTQPEHGVRAFVILDEEDRDKLKYPIRIQGQYAFNRGCNDPIAHTILGITPDKSLKIVVDHVNGNHLDNRKCNLVLRPFRDNVRNKGHYSLNHTGTIGLSKGTFKVKGSDNVYYRYIATLTDPRFPIDPKTEKGKRYTRAVSYGIHRTEEEARDIALAWLKQKREETGYNKLASVRLNDYPGTRE